MQNIICIFLFSFVELTIFTTSHLHFKVTHNMYPTTQIMYKDFINMLLVYSQQIWLSLAHSM